jgi:hypothetical protein
MFPLSSAGRSLLDRRSFLADLAGTSSALALLYLLGKDGRAAAKPIRTVGKHPAYEAPVELYEGRYGPYVEDADGNAMQPTIGADFEAGRPPGATAGVDLRIVFAVNGPLAIPAPGSYAAVASIGGEVLARSRFQAVQVARSN